MPKSKRARLVHLTQVQKKGREHKDKLFDNVREALGEYMYCFVFSVENTRNTHLQSLRQELSDSKIFFGKTKLMSKALGQTPAEAQADGVDALAPHIAGQVGLLFTNRSPEDVGAYFASLNSVDFARAGTVAPRGFVIPPGVVYATGGEVPAEYDVPLEHSIEPELRRLGIPTRMIKGKVVLGEESGEGEGYTVCKEGETLDSRQTRLLKLFSVCMSEFSVKIRAYWTSSSGQVTVVEAEEGDAMEQAE